MTDPKDLALREAEFLLYQTEDGQVRVEVRLDGKTAGPQSITQHITAKYEEGEVDEGAICKPFLREREEGPRQVRCNLNHHSLPIILAIGYRVRSERGTLFRQSATSRLEEHVIKGFPSTRSA